MKDRKKIMKGMLSSLLIVSLVLTAAAGSAPAYAQSRVSSKEEVIYASADANGKIKELNAVNIFDGGKITDYGNYSQVKMLVSEDEINKSGNKIKINAGDKRVYYQGTMKTRQIPWKISIRYYLDGKEYSPKKLAGKSGHLTIHFSVTKNSACSGDFYENYALQAAFTLDTEKCTNIKAKDATIANIGENKQLSYIVLPGKGIDTYITADVENFEMDEVSINGLKEITDKNLELTDGAYKAFEGICTASETILNEKLTENGMSKITLTPYNYPSVLEDLLDDLDGSKVYRTAYDEAYYQVSKKVETQQDALYYQAALQAVKAQLLQNGMDEETADAYLQTEEGQALVANAAAGMSDEQKAQIKDAYIDQMMRSSDVTSQINEAVRKAEEAADQVEDLRTQLDDYRTFYDGLCDYTDAVTEAKDGSDELSENMQRLDENTGLLNDAVIEFRDKISELLDGVSELKDGTKKFLKEISKLKGEVHDIVSDMIDELKGKGMLRSFVSEKNTEIESVQFVIKTDAISVNDAPQEEETVQETLTFWQKLLRLFGMY